MSNMSAMAIRVSRSIGRPSSVRTIGSESSKCFTTLHSRSYTVPGTRYETSRVHAKQARFKSTASPAMNVCPHHSQNGIDGEPKHPKLRHVKKFPIVGSIIPQLSGVPDTILDPYKFWPEMRKQYGDFYEMGIPAFGNADCWYSTIYVITDPKEMVKVVRAGGAYPSGVVENLWVSRKWNETRGMHTSPLFGSGQEWKRIRNFMQTDFLHPQAARGYVPGMIEAAKLASKGAPAMKKDLNTYLGCCAFDLFSTIMFGELTETADPNTEKDPENVRFVVNAADGLSTSIEMLRQPYEMVLGKMLGIETAKLKRSFKGIDVAWEIGQKKIHEFTKRKQRGELNENEQVSYLSRALDRQKEANDISLREAQELAFTGLFAAVDTTSSVLGWNLFNVARHPEVQEKLYAELSEAVATVGGGQLTTEVVEKKNAPYLHAVIRESQRVTPAVTIYVSKKLAEDIEVNGIPLKRGDVVALEGFSLGMDPNIMDRPNMFEPERWLENAVECRAGTYKEIIDHSFFKGPFSQGARRCPGSRVATNEIQVMLSQLVLDWKMTSPVSSLDDVKYSQKTTIELELPEIDFQPRMRQ